MPTKAAVNSTGHGASELTESRFGFIGITEPVEGGTIALRVPSVSSLGPEGASAHWSERARHAIQGALFTELDNLFGYVVRHNTVVCTNDAIHHPGQNTNPPGIPELQSFLGIPLRYELDENLKPTVPGGEYLDPEAAAAGAAAVAAQGAKQH